MAYLSKIIYITVLLCFSFNTSAGVMMQCLDMPKQNELPIDSGMSDCYSEKTDNDESSNCCLDMNSCHTTSLFMADSLKTLVQIQHQAIQLPNYISTLLNTTSPPTPPPKVIS